MKALETMVPIILTIHILIAAALVVVVLLQRSEGGGLGIGGGGGGGGAGLMTGRSAANLLTRSTGALAIGFFATSLVLAILASNRSAPTSILDQPAGEPAATSEPAAPAAPAEPSAPTAD